MNTIKILCNQNNRMDLKNKVVFITGGTGGIGTAFAKLFLQNESKVCLADLFEDVGQKTVKELENTFESSNIMFSKCDVTKDDAFEDAYNECERKFGPVNIFINNAGIVDEINIQRAIDVNLGGTMRGCALALKKMGKHNGGNGGYVINMGSGSGLTPNIGTIYSGTKGGVVMYTRSVGLPLHYSYSGICFMCLCPTLVDTPLIAAFQTGAAHESVYKFLAQIDKFPHLSPETVAEALLKLINDGKSGSVMVVTPGKDLFYVEAADLATFK